MNKKQLFYSFTLFCAIFVSVLLSCEKEDLFEDNRQENQSTQLTLNITNRAAQHLKKHHPLALTKLQKNFFASKSNNGLLYSAAYQMSIDTTNAQHYSVPGSAGDIDIYTFIVKRDSVTPNVLENYLMRINPDGSVEQYLVGYPYTETNSGLQYDIQNTAVVTINDPDLLVQKCVMEVVGFHTTTWYNTGTPCTHPEGNHSEPGDCTCYGVSNGSSCDPPIPGSTGSTTIPILGCGSGSTGSGTVGEPSGSDTGGGGSGSSTNWFDDNTPALPNEEPVETCNDLFRDSLTPEQQAWWDAANNVTPGIGGSNGATPAQIQAIMDCYRNGTEDTAGEQGQIINCNISDDLDAFLRESIDELMSDPNKTFDCENVNKPCKGDPVKNPQLAPQFGPSGAEGALFGCTRYGGNCIGNNGRNKSHNGIDIKNDFNSPVYALFDGQVISNYFQKNGAGYVTRIRSVLPNGEIIVYQYFHLQNEGRLAVGTNISAGDIVGKQGKSGNLDKAIKAGRVDSHVHLKINKYSGVGDSFNYSNFSNNPVNPQDYMNTKFDNQGNITNTNCN